MDMNTPYTPTFLTVVRRYCCACCVFIIGLCAATDALAIAGPPPVISVQPTNRTVSIGASSTFTTTVTSSSALTYQWYFNGTAISGARTNTYTLANVQFTNAGAYYVSITNSGGSIKSTNAILNVNPASTSTLAAPWLSADIGNTGLKGSAFNVSTLYTVNGSGTNFIGSTADQFRYVYQTMIGDGSISAHFVSQSGTNVNGLAGLMIRETTQTGSIFMTAARQGNGATVVRTRKTTGAATTTTNGPTLAFPNYWLQLVRTGTNIAASSSVNGTTWTPFRTNSFTMATNVTFGLIVTSGNTNVLDSDVFTNIIAVP